MRIARAPLRISLFGGGTDLPAWYNSNLGAVLSFTIDKYVWAMVNPKFDGRVRVSYSRTENVDTVQDIEHDLVRETLLYGDADMSGGVEVVTVADIPGTGSGMGASSALTAAMVSCLLPDDWMSELRNDPTAIKYRIARMVCEIEQDMCHKPIGRQDQYASVFGGCNLVTFNGQSVKVCPLVGEDANLSVLMDHMVLLYIGSRNESGDTILSRQGGEVAFHKEVYQKMVRQAKDAFSMLSSTSFAPRVIGEMLRDAWEYKKQLTQSITNPEIDELNERALSLGAWGGKVLGAGGGGFYLAVVPTYEREAFISGMGLRVIPFEYDTDGVVLVQE